MGLINIFNNIYEILVIIIMSDKSLPPLEYLPDATKSAPVEIKQINNQCKTKSGGYLNEPTRETDSNQIIDFYAENQKKQANLEKMKRAIKSNPFVPIGALITAGVLARGVIAMKRNDKSSPQAMMRWRVAAQGVTIIALIAGTFV